MNKWTNRAAQWSCAVFLILIPVSTWADYYKGFVAVWRPGTGTQWRHSGISGEELKSLDAGYFAQGLRLAIIDIYYESDFTANSYTAVWQPGTGGQWWKTGMSLDDFKQADKTYFSQGYTLAALDVQDSEVAAVWRPGAGGQHWGIGMSMNELKSNDAMYFKQGYRLKILKKHGGDQYLAVWRPGTGAQWWSVGKISDFNAKDAGYLNQGFRLASLDFFSIYYSAVWRPGTGVQWVSSGLGKNEFKAQDDAYFKAGLRLTVLEAKKYQLPSGSNSPPPQPINSCAAIANNVCYNIDDTISQILTAGTYSASGCGATEEIAQNVAKVGLMAQVCLTTEQEHKAGCCTYDFK